MNAKHRRRAEYGTGRAPSSFYKSRPSSRETLGQPWPESVERAGYAPSRGRATLYQIDIKCAACRGPVGFLPFRLKDPETAVVRCRPCFDYRKTHDSARPV